MKKPPLGLLAAAAIAAIGLTPNAHAQSTWINPTNGNWSTSAAWTNGVVPNASNAIAVFSNNWTGQTITVDGTYTVGQILGRDTVSGGGGLLLSGGVLVLNSGATKPIISTDNNLTEPGGTAPFNNPLRITSELQGTNGFEKTGPGYLSLEGANTFSGTILLTAPASGGGSFLRLINDNNLGASTNDINVTLSGQAVGLYASTGFTVTLNSDRDIVTSGTGDFWSKTKGTGNILIDGVISGAARFRKNDAGITTLRGSNTFNGGVLLDGGTLVLTNGDNRVATNNTLTFNTGIASTLNLGGGSQTFQSLTVTTALTGSWTNVATNGSLKIASAANFLLQGSNGTILNFAGLTNFSFSGADANRNFTISANSATTGNSSNTFALASTGIGSNFISATTLQIGGGFTNATYAGTGNTNRLLLGTTNVFNATTVNVGAFNGAGVIQFNTGITGGALVLHGTNGSSAVTTLKIGETSSGLRSGSGILDISSGTIDALVTDMFVGGHIANANTADTSSFSMGGGTLTATTLLMANKSGTGTGAISGTYTQLGGTSTITTITMGKDAGSGTAQLLPTFNLNGGKLLATTIEAGGGTYAATSSRNLNINGGTLQNMSGANLTVNGTGTDSNNRINVVLGASGGTFDADTNQSVTLGANTLATGTGVLTKSGNGTLVLAASNNFSGGTAVGAGTILANNNASLGSGIVSMTSGSVLAANGVTVSNNFSIGNTTNSLYSQNFNTIGSGVPTDWTVRTGANASSVGTAATLTTSAVAWATSTGAFNNYASTTGLTSTNDSAAQSASTDRAMGIRQTGSFANPGASFNYAFSTAGQTVDYISLDLMMLSVQPRSTTWSIEYGIGASPTSFTSLGTWSDPGEWGSTSASFTSGTFGTALNNQANVVFRVVALTAATGSGNNDSIGIDNFRLGNFSAGAGTGTLGIGEVGEATFSGNVLVGNTATLSAVASSKATFSGVISGPGTDITKTGAGTVTLSGTSANTFAGKTTVSQGTLQLNKTAGVNAIAGNLEVATSATLLISANNQVIDSSAVTLSGGTIARASGVSETLGDLTLSSSGTLDYGTGSAGVLEFGAWTPGSSVLTINNFFADNILRFSSDLSSFISSSTGTSFSNANFSINGMTAAGFSTNWNGSTFTITSVPEPSTVLAALGLTGLMLWPARRRIGTLLGRK